MKTLKQLNGTFMLVVITASVLLAVALSQLSRVSEKLSSIQDTRFLSAQLADELRQSSDDLTRLARTYVVTGEAKWEEQYFDVLKIRNGELPRPAGYERIYWDFLAAELQPVNHTGKSTQVSLLETMKTAGFTENELGLLTEAGANSDDLVQTETIAMNLVKGLYPDERNEFTRKGKPDLDTARAMMHSDDYHRYKAKIMGPVDEFLYSLDQRTASEVSEALAVRRLWQNISFAAASLMILVSIASLWMIYRWVNNRLGAEVNTVMELVSEIASGNLSHTIVNHCKNPNSVMGALSNMTEQISTAVSQVRIGAESVAHNSARIASDNQNVSTRTERQVSALEATASSMEEVGTTVKHNATNANQANSLARNAREVAEKGGEVVSAVVDTMNGINSSSKEISNIINVIDDIAFQTNLLALNAAVESARAGEQGRGFAVVATEVRDLAQRSAGAAEEVKGLITKSVERVTHGTKLVGDALNTMSEIVRSINEVTEIMNNISVASNEQNLGVAQIAQAINNMDEATQQNASLVKQSATSAAQLDEQAQQLLQAVAVFRLKDLSTGVVQQKNATDRMLAPGT